MNTTQALLLFFAALLETSCSQLQGWKPAPCPIPTRWSADVSPKNVHSDYPRPQMVRDEWRSLNGLWDYAVTPRAGAAPAPAAWDGKILVPFPIESSLSGIGRRVDEAQELWYRRTFEVPDGWRSGRVMIHFGAVDYEDRIWINGTEVGGHRGGYGAHDVDVTAALLPQKKQEIVVRVLDDTEAEQPRGKQVRKPEGIWYTPCTGIWQSVWMEPVAAGAPDRIMITPDLDAGAVHVRAVGAAGERVRCTASLDGKEMGVAEGAAEEELKLRLSEVQPWTPDAPILYDLQVDTYSGSTRIDRVKSYFGMRKIEIARDSAGVPRVMLNGSPIFQAGPLDQGFWPDGIYTAPTDEAMRFDLDVTKRLGFNMVRKHVKVEPERWYSYCDRAGLLVWQDMPSGDMKTPEGKRQFESELQEMMRQLHNHPSIVTWVVFNEGWGQYDTKRIVDAVKRRDPSRLVNQASGWNDEGVGDLSDAHVYPGPGAPKADGRRAAVLGEFGGLGLALDGHTWVQQHWGYQAMSDRAALDRKFANLWARVGDLRIAAGLCAAVYTQTTDVETECNGFLTYDRSILKLDEARARAAVRGEAPRTKLVTIVPDARTAPQEWAYSIEPPPADWMTAAESPKDWKRGPSGFGTAGTPGARVGTRWSTANLWMRREFDLPDPVPASLLLSVHHDEDAEIYINGALVAKLPGYSTDYDETSFAVDAARLHAGKNTIAVHCRQTGGGQYIDVGIVAEVPR